MREITREDFTPDTSPPRSIRELVEMELSTTTLEYKGKDYHRPEQPPDIDELMEQVYRKIEQEAIRLFHSNEAWALKSYCFQTILKDSVESDENLIKISDQLMSPVVDFTNKGYDPLRKFKEKLTADGKPKHSIAQYMVIAAKFVGWAGRQRRYSDELITEYIAHLRTDGYIKKTKNRKTGETTWAKADYTKATLLKECRMLQTFFRVLNGRKDYTLPVSMPKVPGAEDLHQPMLTKEQLEDLIFNTAINYVPARWIQHLCISSLFGCRISELTDYEVNLDGANDSFVNIYTVKGGTPRRHQLPPEVIPLFLVSTEPMSESMLYHAFKRMTENLDLPERSGWHSIRRTVITCVYDEVNAKDLTIARFFRWKTGMASIGMLPTYVKTPVAESDAQIMSQHPLREVWSVVVPAILENHPQYQGLSHSMKIVI